MTFEIDQAETHWWPVQYTLPRADAVEGATPEQPAAPGPVVTFEVEYRILGEAELKSLGDRLQEQKLTDAQLVNEVCTTRARGLTSGGKELPPDLQTWLRLRKLRGMDYHLAAAFFAAQSGGASGN